MNYYALAVEKNSEWTEFEVEENAILRYLGKTYDMDKQRYIYGFKVIGHPVKDEPITELRISK